MIDNVVHDWLQELETEMGGIAFNELSPIEKLKRTVRAVENSLTRLKSFVLKYPFSSDADEIQFFKQVKPKFYCWKIYAFERYSVESWIPGDKIENKRSFLLAEIKSIERFFRLHGFHYQYYKIEATELDELFFLRNNSQGDSILVPNVGEPDPGFATKGDYLFAKFMALEKLVSWIRQQIFGLDGLPPATIGETRAKKLKWTGESINLLEVAYGFYYTGQLNGGKASIIDIVKELEEVFGVSLGRPYRRLAEIRQRKKLSRTKYIDEMGLTINKKLDDENEFRPNQ